MSTIPHAPEATDPAPRSLTTAIAVVLDETGSMATPWAHHHVDGIGFGPFLS